MRTPVGGIVYSIYSRRTAALHQAMARRYAYGGVVLALPVAEITLSRQGCIKIHVVLVGLEMFIRS